MRHRDFEACLHPGDRVKIFLTRRLSMTGEAPNFPTDRHGWSELLPAREPRPALAGKHRVPWVVVGAGVTGLACARRLAELHPGDPVLLLEAREVGQGASGRNSGFAVATSHFPGVLDRRQSDNWQRVNRINRAGLERLQQLVDEHSIDCQWRRQGFFHTATGPAALREYENFRRNLDGIGIEHETLDRAGMADRLGTDYYRAGIRIVDGALLQPALLVRGLAASLPANVSLHERSPVLSIGSGTPAQLRLKGAEVQADHVVLAVNFEAGRLGFLRSYLTGSTLSGSFTRRLEPDELDSLGDLPEWGALSLHGGGATLRLSRDGRISIRNTAEYHGSLLLSDAELARRQAMHRRSFEQRFPQLAQVPFEYAWSGVEGISRNATNFFGRQRDEVYLAGGYNGSGLSRGTAFGSAIAEYANGVETPLVTDCLASAPAAWMPPRPLLDIAAFFTVRSRFRGVGADR